MAKGAEYSRRQYRNKMNLDGQRRAFVTGSQAYGNPGPNSDVDLVIRCDDLTRDLLLRLADSVDLSPHEYGPNHSLRFGNLNVICAVNDAEYDIWAKGTEALLMAAPVTRDVAVAHFDRLRENAE